MERRPPSGRSRPGIFPLVWTALFTVLAFAGQDYVGGPLYDNVVKTLTSRYYDQAFRTEVLPRLAAELRPKALKSRSLSEERRAVHELLSRIPASHLGLLSASSRDMLFGELQRKDAPTLGFQLQHVAAGFVVTFLLEGGPAERSGLRSGDRVLEIDGIPCDLSPRLDWRTDDAYLDDDRDPPMHAILVTEGERVELKIEPAPGRAMNIEVTAAPYSAWRGTQASVRTVEQDGLKIGILHLWYIYVAGIPELLTDTLTTRFDDHDAFVLDLRGRGGSGTAIKAILEIFEGPDAVWTKPVVVLVDRHSRSAKEVLVYEMKKRGIAKIVGEATAGAVIPATFADVGYGTILMFPLARMPVYTDAIELKPVEPDVLVERAGAYSDGADPIAERGIAVAASLAEIRLQSVLKKRASPWQVPVAVRSRLP